MMTAGDPRTRFPTRSGRAPEQCGCGVLARREIDAILTIGNGAPTIANVAARLSMNVRTLQRCLADEEQVFRDLLSECRQRHAVEALTTGTLSIAAIARQLGYSDPAHFTRAFKRWTGCTPRQFRTEEVAAPESIVPLLTAHAGQRRCISDPVPRLQPSA